MADIANEYAQRVQTGDITSDPVQQAVLPLLQRVADDLDAPVKRGFFRKAPEPIKGLYLWGGVGRGKSMLMDLFVEQLKVAKRRVHFHAFMQEVHAAMHHARASDTEDALRPFLDQTAKDIRLLAFDEMQITDITDAMIVGRLFQGLMDRGVAIVTTSNRAPDDLYKNGLNRQLFLPFIDILKSRMQVHELASDTDYRQTVLAGSTVYFTPANAQARAQIDDIWNSLTEGNSAPLILHVNKRDVELPAYENGVARASFFDLCGKNLGPADYLAIAGAVRVLIIENIPTLSRHNFNEAKRFVTLIDALYEAGVRLIASAAAQPEMLYVEGSGSFEFERTASRLREMQGSEWGLNAQKSE